MLHRSLLDLRPLPWDAMYLRLTMCYYTMLWRLLSWASLALGCLRCCLHLNHSSVCDIGNRVPDMSPASNTIRSSIGKGSKGEGFKGQDGGASCSSQKEKVRPQERDQITWKKLGGWDYALNLRRGKWQSDVWSGAQKARIKSKALED